MKASSLVCRFLLALCCIPSTVPLRATVIAIGNAGTTTQTFNREVMSEVFERSTGTIYIGLAANSTGTTDNFAVASAPRVFNTSNPPLFTGIGSNDIFADTNNGAEFLALASTPPNVSPFRAVVEPSTPPANATVSVSALERARARRRLLHEVTDTFSLNEIVTQARQLASDLEYRLQR